MKIKAVMQLTVAVAICTWVAFFVYAPTELFPASNLTMTEAAKLSTVFAVIAALLFLLIVGGASLAASAAEHGRKYSARSILRPHRLLVKKLV